MSGHQRARRPQLPLSGRVEPPTASDLLAVGGEVGSANETRTTGVPSAAGHGGRITARRVAAIRRELSGADWALVRHIAAAKVLTGKQLRILVQAGSQASQRALRRRLQALEAKRLLARLGRRIGGVRAGSDSYVWALDVAGQRLIAAEPQRRWRRPWTPTERSLRHALALSELYVGLVTAEQHGQIELVSFAAEPGCWRSFVGPGGGRQTLKPDAHVVIVRGLIEVHAWIEVDMASESLPWITDKAGAYSRYYDSGKEQAVSGIFPRCLWLAPTRQRALQLVDALGRLPAEQWRLHQVATQGHALAALLAGSEQTSGERP